MKEENKLLLDIAFEMYDLLSRIDFSNYDGELKMCFGEKVQYDTIPWEKWETILDQCDVLTDTKALKDIQLQLF